jgi:tRNA (mo5U34)-methyltransferase
MKDPAGPLANASLAKDEEVRIAAGDPGFEERIQRLADRVHSRFRYHSIELPDGSVLPGLQPVEHLRWRLDLFGLPQDLRGKRVLDVGAWDGWFSFECERRGAKVVAVDCIALDTFHEAKELIGSQVEYLTLDVNELSARTLGTFDIVLFFGVLYHLRHPLLGLEKAVELSTDLTLIESFVIQREERAIPSVMEFYERSELGGQVDNWCGPSPECLMSMCRSAGFAQVELKDITNQRASVVCRRSWPEPDAQSTAPVPQLRSVINNRTYISNFHPLKDEYLSCYFTVEERGLTPDSVLVEVDGLGTHALTVAETGLNGYQANCLKPPGLAPGRHEVRLRTRHSARSNPAAIIMLDEAGRNVSTVSSELPPEPPELCSAEFSRSGDQRFAVNRGGSLVCYFRSAAQSMAPADVGISIGDKDTRADAISFLGDNIWQANVLLDQPVAEGTAIQIRLGDGLQSLVSPVRQMDGSRDEPR